MNARSLCLGLGYLALLVLAVAAGTGAAAPPELPVCRPVSRDITDYEEFTGRTEAAQSVELRPRVTGYVDRVTFQEGGAVKRGDLLFEIDPRPYQAELDRANAEVARAEAHFKRADAEHDRAKKLLANHSIGPDDLDRIAGERAEAEASLHAAKAARELAQLNLSFTKVTAPIDGRIGRPLLTPGNLAVADTTLLGTIVSVDPMDVFFAVDERTLLRLARAQREGKLKAGDGAGLPVQIALADGEGFVHRGKVEALGTQVDPAAGTVQWRAVFPNPDGVVLPGMFARVRLLTSAPHKGLLVPESSVGTDQGQAYVLVVNDANVVERRPVKLGAADDGLRVVTEGVTAEDRVAVEPPRGVRPGETVRPKEVPVPVPEAKDRPRRRRP